MKICCISDTHERQEELRIPDCDLLIHAGDITMRGAPAQLERFNGWCKGLIERQITRKIILIAGNHDLLFEKDPEKAQKLVSSSTYLQDSGTEWENIRFWGTPWQPWFFDWAFNLRTESELESRFQFIPEETGILIVHGPPRGILDRTIEGERVGSTALLEKIFQVRPKLVVFGHIHESYGLVERDGITFINASICDVRYRAVNAPVIFTWESTANTPRG
jgi:Icc-related predicted phosphoesterase